MTENKKRFGTIFSLTILVNLVFLSSGGILSAQTSFDPKRSQHEIQVMISILSTSIQLAKEEFDPSSSDPRRTTGIGVWSLSSRGGGVRGYYLYGQGAVFTIPFPCLTGKTTEEWEKTMEKLAQLEAGTRKNVESLMAQANFLESQVEMARQLAELERLQLEEGFYAPVAPPAPPAAPAPSAREARNERNLEARKKEIRERIARLKVRLQETREKTEEQRTRAEKERTVLREELFRVIATHGDSLTHVKDNEYINLILKESCEPFGWNASDARQTILSVRKTDVRAYRSGELTLDQLRSKFIEYQY